MKFSITTLFFSALYKTRSHHVAVVEGFPVAEAASSSGGSTRSARGRAAALKRNKSIDYEKVKYKALFPKRKSEEAAVVEWGNSAIISAIDAVVAHFGPQTSMGASFEVETSPILADPIDGYTNLKPKVKPGSDSSGEEGDDESDDKKMKLTDYTTLLKNADDIHGNVCVMTNSAGMSGVEMAKVAKDSGAAALMVVNVLDPDNPDSAYPLKCESDEECQYAEDYIDIPVIMVSLSSGNVLTTANDTDETSASERHKDPQAGMPERVRLYAGGDRPFFEDVRHDPVIYLIHNLLTAQECDMLIKQATKLVEPFDETKDNYLEGTATSASSKEGSSKGSKTVNVERTYLWSGALRSPALKAVDERLEQVTGFPYDHSTDFQVNKYTNGSYHTPHYDDTAPVFSQLASIHVFLTDGDGTSGGEFVFPHADPNPVKITPKRGMAVVYHNLDEQGELDWSSIHGELPIKGDDDGSNDNPVIWTARKWILTDPVPRSHRIALPAFAFLLGGKLPTFIKTLHDKLLEQYGPQQGTIYFEKAVTVGPIAVVFVLVAVIGSLITGLSSSKDKKKDESTTPSKKETTQEGNSNTPTKKQKGKASKKTN